MRYNAAPFCLDITWAQYLVLLRALHRGRAYINTAAQWKTGVSGQCAIPLPRWWRGPGTWGGPGFPLHAEGRGKRIAELRLRLRGQDGTPLAPLWLHRGRRNAGRKEVSDETWLLAIPGDPDARIGRHALMIQRLVRLRCAAPGMNVYLALPLPGERHQPKPYCARKSEALARLNALTR